MRSKLFMLTVGLAAVGCGGGSDKPKLPDAKVFMDAAIDAAPVCSVACDNPNFCGNNMGSPDFPALRLGTPGDPNANPPVPADRPADDWFFVPEMGSLMGRTVFGMLLGLSPQGAPALDVIGINAVKPQAGNFPVNMPINLDPNPLTEVPAAYSFFLGDATVVNGQIQAVAQEYYASNGSITFTAIGETDGQTIDGGMAAAAGNPPTPVNYREIDMNGADVPGGCSASIAFAWFLTQDSTPAFQPSAVDPTSNEFFEKHGYRALTADERTAVINYMSQRRQAQ